MASEAVATGSSSEGLTPAQKLMEQHDHHATVEDVIDEEDLAHPPPSAAVWTSGSICEPITLADSMSRSAQLSFFQLRLRPHLQV